MKTTKNIPIGNWNDARATEHVSESSDTDQQPTIMLYITRTITDHIPLPHDLNRSGFTIGGMIDSHLRGVVAEGHDVHDLFLEIPPGEWEAFKQSVQRRV